MRWHGTSVGWHEASACSWGLTTLRRAMAATSAAFAAGRDGWDGSICVAGAAAVAAPATLASAAAALTASSAEGIASAVRFCRSDASSSAAARRSTPLCLSKSSGFDI